MTLQRTFTCSKDVQLVQSGSTNGGVGKGMTVSVGQTPGGAKTRTEFEFEANWDNVVTLVKAELILRVTDRCASPGGAVKFYAERLTTAFKEGDYADTCGVGSNNAEVWPGTGTATTVHRAEYVGTPSNGDYIRLNITTLVADVLAANETKVRLRLIASDGAGGYDESTAARYVGFHSSERGNDGVGFKPRIELSAFEWHTPDVPSEVTPATTDLDTVNPHATRVDRRFVVRARFTVADANDYLTASDVQFFPKGSTDNSSGTILTGNEIRTLTGTGVFAGYAPGARLVAHTIATPDTRVGLEMLGRVRVRCAHGLWSSWTRLSDMRLIPNTRPSKPTGLGIDTGSTTPDMTGRHNDDDRGSTVSAVETQIVKESAAGVSMLMNRTSHQPGDPETGKYITDPTAGGPQTVPKGGTLWRISYDGVRPLRSGERVKRRHRTVDQFDAVGDWTDWTPWVVGEAAVPTFIPDPATKRDDLTPLLGASYIETITGLKVEVYAANDLASLRLWAPPERTATGTSKVIEYGSVGKAKPLAWGQQPWGRALVRIASTGDVSPWTELQPILLNSLPLAPVVSVDTAVLDDSGTVRVPTLTPRLLCAFRDPDRPNDTATKQIVQVFRQDAAGSPLYQRILTTGIEDWADIPVSAALAWETAYVAKVRYADTSGELGPFGVYAFTTHRPPRIVAGVAPVVGDPTPTLNWTSTFYAGATQSGYRIKIVNVAIAAAPVGLLDTGFVEDTTATSYVVPAYVLPTGVPLEARVYVYDTLNVPSLLNGQAFVASAISSASATTIAAAPIVSAAPTSLPADTFTRGAQVDTWGTSSSGHTYVYQATQADYDTNGTQGTIVLAAAKSRRAHFDNVRLGNVTAQVDVKTDKLAVGGTLAAGVDIRVVDLSNHYRAEVAVTPDATTVDLFLLSFVDGVRTVLGRFRTALVYATGTFYTVKVNAVTSYVPSAAGGGWSTALQAKAWATGGGEPGYQVTATDATATLQEPGSVGVGARTGSGITNANVTFTFDNIATTSP